MTLSSQQAPTGQAPAADGLTREILTLAVVVVLGSIMTILDATIVNVALPTLGRDLHASISVIQWVSTAYLLAFASVIPLTGWISGRFGAKPVWLASLGLFMAGSLLAGSRGLIERARRLAEMNFLDIVRDLAPDGLGQAQNVVGKPSE